NLRVVVPSEMQLLYILQRRERLEHLSSVLVAASRVPDRTRQVKLAQMEQTTQLDQFVGMHHTAGQVDSDDLDFAFWQLPKIGYGLSIAFEDDPAFPADHPLGEVAIRGRMRQSGR